MEISTYFEALHTCTQNSYLSGYVISEHTVQTWLNCLTLCVWTEDCRSVNVWQNPLNKMNVTCQLNWSIVDGCSDLQPAQDVRYMMKKYSSVPE